MSGKRVPGEVAYVVTAPLVIVRCAPDGHRVHLYDGAPIPASADPRDVARMLESGQVAEVGGSQ